MNKFMKLAIVVLVLGITVTVVRKGMKKSGDGHVVENSQSVDQHAGQGSAEDANKISANDKKEHDGKAAGGTENSDDFMGGVTGRSGEGSDSATAGKGASAPGVGVTTPGGVAGTAEMAHQSKPDSNCFAYEYKHQKEALNKDIEDFLDYSNAFPIFHDKVTQKSICVKVNGKPTAFKLSKYKNQQEVVIGSVVGPESVIKVSYCVGTSACKEACAVKTNRFMDDLMSDAGDEDEFKESWGDAKEQKQALQAKVKEFRSVASENKELQKQSTIRSWDTVSQNDYVCKKEK